MTRVGVTGHRDLTGPTRNLIAAALAEELRPLNELNGVSSLAEGADQIFAERVLEAGGALTAVIPCAAYSASFSTGAGVAAYRELRAQAAEVIELPFPFPPRRHTGRPGGGSSAWPTRCSRCGTGARLAGWAGRPMWSPSRGSAACGPPWCGRRARAAVER